jgi:thymidine kinase
MARFYFKYGVMKSNKSMDCLTTAKKYEIQGKKYLAFKPSLDTRDGSKIKSRAMDYSITADAVIKANQKGLMKAMAKLIKPNCILVDEVQFMKEYHVKELSDIALYLDIPVIAYGLLTDFQGKMFEGSKAAIEYAEKYEEIKTECFNCNRKAIRNMRTQDGKPIFHGKQIHVGDEDYEPTCIVCYNKFLEESKK